MNWSGPKNINHTKWTGVLLLAAALIILVLSLIEIKSNEIMLATQNLSIEEVWLYEGALQWWQNIFTTTILPTTQILTTTGIATILTSQLLKFAQKDHQIKKNPTNNPLKKRTKLSQN